MLAGCSRPTEAACPMSVWPDHKDPGFDQAESGFVRGDGLLLFIESMLF